MIDQLNAEAHWDLTPNDLTVARLVGFAVQSADAAATVQVNLTINVNAASVQIAPCSHDGEINCLANPAFKAVDMVLLTPEKLKNGVTVAGKVGNYPSALNPLAGSTGTDLSSFLGSVAAGTYQFWKSDGTRVTGGVNSPGTIVPTTTDQLFSTSLNNAFTVKGDVNLTPSNILSTATVFGVQGQVVKAYSPTPVGTLVTQTVRSSCAAHHTAGQNTSGRYLIDVDGNLGPLPVMQAECDMTTDGGGWTLVMNYLHQGGTAPRPKSLISILPLQGSTILGLDESNSATFWGHAVPGILVNMSFTDARFYCTNSNASTLHFKSNESTCINYLKTGIGNCTNFKSGSTNTTYAGSEAAFIDSVDGGTADSGENTLTNMLFLASLGGGNHQWAIQGGAFGSKFVCSGGDQNTNSFHQVWVR